MRARRADWHDDYTWKAVWKYFQPQRGGHGAYWYRWSTTNEIEWKQNYRLWMQFINEYKNLDLRLRLRARTGTAAGSGVPSHRSAARGHVAKRRAAGHR
ncbi:hypothetical protein G6F32_015819 [Rhizopus arrhizus]|nr:hypothetical protein G6F32_015819 [Rhizopus arrhizus]